MQHVVFDFDGTLIDGYGPVTESVNFALSRSGRAMVSAEQVRPLVGQGLEWLLARFFPEEDVPRAVELFRRHYAEVYLQGNFLLADTERVLAQLHGAGLMLAIASNKPAERVRGICDHLDITRYLSVILGAGDVENLKPHPQMVLEALRRMKTGTDDTLYVGDTPTDIQTSRAAGLPIVCVLGGSATREQLLPHHPDLVIERLEQLLEVMGID